MYFKNEYEFLSNFYEIGISYNGLTYCCVESAYQAQKYNNKQIFTKLTARQSKFYSKKVKMDCNDWEFVKLNIMEELLNIKFANNELKEKLISTYPTDIVEENTWNDTYWGVCNGIGENNLGKLLMKIRQNLMSH